MKKTYLGDDVYVENDQLGICLTFDNERFSPKQRIYLHHHVMLALERYIKNYKRFEDVDENNN